MTPQFFCDSYRSVADKVSEGTGIDSIALLAQWWNETAGGTSWAGAPFNLGNIENNGKVVLYASYDEFVAACIATFHNGLYDAVLAATNAIDQLAAIVASPWASGHYGGSLMAEYALVEDFELTAYEKAQLNSLYTLFFEQDGSVRTPALQDVLQTDIPDIQTKVADIQTKVTALTPPTPSPAVKFSGTFTGISS